VREARQVLKLGELIAGSKEAYWERPFINFGYCSIVSPLTMDYDSTEMLMFFAENGVTAYGTMNAEWLAAATLAQMSKPGTAQIYNFLPVFADMRDGAYAPGAIEIGMMNAAVCQMARFYNVPAGGYLGLTNAKVADAQAGFEKGMSPLLGALAGVDFIVMGALQDALMSFDFGQAVIDNEIALMIKRVRAGFGFSEESASLEEIKATGPGGMFAANPATLERMHEATFMPELADRKLREQWEQEGASTVHQRAMNKALEILSSGRPHPGRVRRPGRGRVRGARGLAALRRGRGGADPPEARQPPPQDRLTPFARRFTCPSPRRGSRAATSPS
jgi:trimethylamine--corrinoid protein Co-methyltransferase